MIVISYASGARSAEARRSAGDAPRAAASEPGRICGEPVCAGLGRTAPASAKAA